MPEVLRQGRAIIEHDKSDDEVRIQYQIKKGETFNQFVERVIQFVMDL